MIDYMKLEQLAEAARLSLLNDAVKNWTKETKEFAMAAHPVAILDMIARIKQLEEALRKIARMTDCDHRGAHEEVGCPMGIIRTALENSSD